MNAQPFEPHHREAPEQPLPAALRSAPAAAAERLYPPAVRSPAAVLPLWRFLPTLLRNPLATIPAPVRELPGFYAGRGERSVLWVTAPALVKQVLLDDAEAFRKSLIENRVFRKTLGEGILTAEGADWRWQRMAVAPLFRHASLLQFVPVMAAAADRLLAGWHELGAGERAIDHEITRATFEVISNTVLAGDEGRHARTIESESRRFLDAVPWEVACAIFKLPDWMPHPLKRRADRAVRRMRASVAELIAWRRCNPGRDNDIFDRLSAARHPETGQPMSDELLIDNLLTFLEAGHETTAKALTWTLYLAARAPHWQQRMRAEINAVAGDGPVLPEHVDRLTTVQMVLKEAMRLYPPAPILTRTALRDIRIGDWQLGAGSLVVVPIYMVHRHRRLWRDPDRFDPARFTPECEAVMPRYQYMPFGAGARICIGMSFAMIEATVLLATLIRGARFEWLNGHNPEPVSRVTLRPSGGMPLHVVPLG